MNCNGTNHVPGLYHNYFVDGAGREFNWRFNGTGLEET